MHKMMVLGILMMLFLASPVYAELYSCLDNNTLFFNTTIYVGNDAIPVNYTESCDNGCDANRCNPLEYESNIYNMIFIIIIVVGIVMIYKFTRGR